MIKGTRVGQAYVSLAIDGDGINEELVHSMGDVDYEKLGRDAEGRYTNGWKKVREDIAAHLQGIDKEFDTVLDRVHGSMVNSNAISDGLDQMVAKAFDDGKLDSLIRDVGHRAGVEFGTSFDTEVTRIVLDSVRDAVGNAASKGGGINLNSILSKTTGTQGGVFDTEGPLAGKAAAQVAAAQEKMLAAQKKAEEEYTKFLETEETKRVSDDKKFSETRQKQYAYEVSERKKLEDKFDKEFAGLFDRIADDESFKKFTQQAQAQIDAIHFHPSVDRKSLDDVVVRLRDDLERASNLQVSLDADIPLRERAKIEAELAALHAKINVDIDPKRLNASLVEAVAAGGAEKTLGNTIGKIFGAGSRNNFFNVFGKSIGGLVTVSEKAFKGVASLFDKVESGASAAGSEVLTMGEKFTLLGVKAQTALGDAFAAIAESGPGALVVVAAISAALSILASVIVGLTAAVIALASTITSALVSALAVGAAGFAALGVAAGLAVLAFKSMDDAQKKLLSEAFKPLKEEAVGLGQVVLHNLTPAFSTWASHLERALAIAKPLAEVMGGALARAGDTFTHALSGPGIQQFFAALTSNLPTITRQLSSALGQFINGLGSVFAAIMPEVTAFSTSLNTVATTFANWASSVKGQTSIKDFFDRAATSASSLWNFIKKVGAVLSTLLFSVQGQGAGNNIFDKMSGSLQKFNTFINKPGNLTKFFKEGETAASTLGDSIKAAGDLLRGLNDSKTLAGIEKIAKLAADASSAFNHMPGPIKSALTPLTQLLAVLGKINDLYNTIAGKKAPKGPGSSTGNDAPVPPTHPGASSPSLGSLTSGRVAAGVVAGSKPNSLSDLFAARTAPNPGAVAAGLIKLGQDALLGTTTGTTAINAATKAVTSKTKAASNKLSKAMLEANTKLANKFIKDTNTIAAQIKQASVDAGKTRTDAYQALVDSFNSTVTSQFASSSNPITTALSSLIDQQTTAGQAAAQQITDNADQVVTTAQDAVASAANSLKSAKTKSAAASASKQLAAANNALVAAKAAQTKANGQAAAINSGIAAANELIKQQAVLTQANADALANGVQVQNATLADYADAQTQVATKLSNATSAWQGLVDQMNQYQSQVSDSIKSFGALTTATASSLNGVTQALSANDITANLQSRLAQIKAFQANINTLIAEGISNDALKQITDAGVDGGSQFASALAAGGVAAVQQVNSLTSQIGAAGDALGTQTASRFYQSGIDAAQGVIDGLNALGPELDAAALALGKRIEAGIRAALDSHSPSRAMIRAMGDVGDGMVLGLDAQANKVSAASSALAARIPVSPEVARYAASRGDSPVSGNEQKLRDVNVYTTTDDPVAVAHEVLNEITGRL